MRPRWESLGQVGLVCSFPVCTFQQPPMEGFIAHVNEGVCSDWLIGFSEAAHKKRNMKRSAGPRHMPDRISINNMFFNRGKQLSFLKLRLNLCSPLLILEIHRRAVSEDRKSGRNGEHTLVSLQLADTTQHIHTTWPSALVFPVCCNADFCFVCLFMYLFIGMTNTNSHLMGVLVRGWNLHLTNLQAHQQGGTTGSVVPGPVSGGGS